MFRLASLLLLMILAPENQGGKQENILFEETFNNTELEHRGWYDGTAYRIAEHSVRGEGCIEYEWILNDQHVQGSSPHRHLFETVEAVYIRFYLRLSKDWEWSGRNYHPHLTLYVEPVAGKLRLAATDIQNKDMPHGLTQGPMRGGYNGMLYDSKEVLFKDDEWHCIEAYFRLNTLDTVNDQPDKDGTLFWSGSFKQRSEIMD